MHVVQGLLAQDLLSGERGGLSVSSGTMLMNATMRGYERSLRCVSIVSDYVSLLAELSIA